MPQFYAKTRQSLQALRKVSHGVLAIRETVAVQASRRTSSRAVVAYGILGSGRQ
jgi:hypothetical protein